jgi:hypothetical protein
MSTRFRLLAPALAITLLAAACGGSASPAPSATPVPSAPPTAEASAPPTAEPSAGPTTAAICGDAATFRASIAALTSLKLLEVGTSGVTAALGDVAASAQALLVSGKDLLAQPLASLIASVKALQATLTGLGDQPGLGSALVAVRAAIENIKTAAADVETALGTTCPAQ